MKPNSFELNKVIGALLLASIIAMVAGFTANGLYTGSIVEHAGGHHEEKRGYTIAGAENADATGNATPAAEEKPVDIMPLMATADVAAGQAQIKKCTACHTFEQGGKNGVGPNQWGLVGSHFAHMEGYNYSDALKSRHSETWTEQALSDFLANPKKFAPGNKMSFAGMKNPQDRANLIAYLKTLK
jgi:cytochrome c